MFVRCGRTSGAAEASDPNPVALAAYLKISDMKYSQGNVSQITQARIIKNYGRVYR